MYIVSSILARSFAAVSANLPLHISRTASAIQRLADLLQDRQWTIQSTSAVKGEGLGEGMDWLANVLASQQ